jgi:hypothetical protein
VTPSGQSSVCAAGQSATVDPGASGLADVLQSGAADCSGTETAAASSNSATNPASGSSGAASTSNTQSRTALTAAPASVEASDASQLQITAARFTTRAVRSARKLGLVVTVRGQESRLVRNGIVGINDLPVSRVTCLCQRTTFTNPLGQAAFTIPVDKSMLGKRLYFQITARTPTLRVTKLVSVRVP